MSFNFSSVKKTEGWPLCISPDCRVLACRTDHGVDISDISNGKVLGEIQSVGDAVTTPTFSSDSKMLAIGKFSGMVEV